jgi:cystathionine beta-lyase/cystathionine gamma-synthase
MKKNSRSTNKPQVHHFSTQAIHAGQEPDPATGALMPGLGENKGYVYSRVSNPTRRTLEKNIATLECARDGVAFATGMAAIDAVFHLLRSGEHIILSRHIYGGTYRILTKVLEQYGISASFIDTRDKKEIENALRASTKMIFVETPTNPIMEITDLGMIADFAKKHHLFSVVDNTFATPYLQQPLAWGIDIVVHSMTKYLNGHSDMLGGIAVTNNSMTLDTLKFYQKAVGGTLSPFDAWLCLRGIKTLAVRMKQHCENAEKIAEFLHHHPKIKKVYYPGLPDHPQHRLAKKQMKSFGGMISFDLGSLRNAKKFFRRITICTLAESLGGVESLISHPATMTHASLSPIEQQTLGITDGLIRLSVGIEDAEDILQDLSNALASS